MLNVLYMASSTVFNVLSGLDEHVSGGHDIGDGRHPRMLSRDPNRYWDVVRGLPKGYGKQSVHTEQQLSTAVIICCKTRNRQISDQERVGAGV